MEQLQTQYRLTRCLTAVAEFTDSDPSPTQAIPEFEMNGTPFPDMQIQAADATLYATGREPMDMIHYWGSSINGRIYVAGIIW